MESNSFLSDLRALLKKHSAEIPKFAYGTKQSKNQILYSGPYFDENETLAAIDTFVNGKWSVNGEKVYRFETEFSKYIGQQESVMVNSGSSANLLMIAAIKKYFGWADNDGIIVSPVGFPTTVSAITLNNLTPHFIDIELDTLNFDLNNIEFVLFSKQTSIKAIFVSPVLGNPPDFDRLIKLAEKYNIKIILDGCDSLGSKWNGKHLSDYAIATSCSFYPAHHITTLQGGMISSNNLEIIKIARSMSTWGRSCYCKGAAAMLPNGACGVRFSNWLPNTDCIVDHKYVYGNIGYNLQPLDLQGAIGLEQLKKIEKVHELRKTYHDQIMQIFLKNTAATHPVKLSQADVSWFGVPLICPSAEYKQKLVAFLEKNNIQTRNYFAGNILLHPAYSNLIESDQINYFINSNEVFKRVFFVGCPPFYTEENINYIDSIVKVFKE
jgi:CDP-6-deoxy-D-xylo-4-hexulose-3-dehydrase